MSIVWGMDCESHTQKLMLLALADNASDEGYCWPSLTTLTKKCALSRQGILNQVAMLEKAGFLRVDRSQGIVNKYTLILVNAVDQSTRLTGQPHRPPPVNAVDHHQSTRLTGVVYGVDPNHHEPSVEPSVEPSRGDVREAEELELKIETRAKANKAKGEQEDVQQFFKSQLNLPESDAEWFFYKCEGNGWTNGGKKILDWKATARSWKAGGYMPSQKIPKNGNGNHPPHQPVKKLLSAAEAYGI